MELQLDFPQRRGALNIRRTSIITDPQEMHAVLGRITVTVLPKMCQQILESIISADNLYCSFQKKSDLKILVVGTEQAIITTMASNGYKHFTVQLCYKILRHEQWVGAPRQNWGNVPLHTDIHISDDIERIRLARNKIVSMETRNLDSATFLTLMDEFREIAKRVDFYLKKDAMFLLQMQSTESMTKAEIESTVDEIRRLSVIEDDPFPVHAINQGRTNYARLGLVVVDIFPNILREIMRNNIAPEVLYRHIGKQRQNNPSVFNKMTHEEQVNLNTLTNKTYEDIDFTTMYKLMRSFSLLDGPTQGWGKQPTNADLTISDDVERLRFARNKIVHHIKTDINLTEMNDSFSNIVDITERIDTYLGKLPGPKFAREVLNFQTHCMDSAMEQKYYQALKEIEDIQEKFLVESVHFYYGNTFAHFIRDVQNKAKSTVRTTISLVLEDINEDEKRMILNELKTEINSGLVNIEFKGAVSGSLIIYIDILDSNLLSTEHELGHQIYMFLCKALQLAGFNLKTENEITVVLIKEEDDIEVEFPIESDNWEIYGDEISLRSNSLCLELDVNTEIFNTEQRMQSEMGLFVKRFLGSNGKSNIESVSARLEPGIVECIEVEIIQKGPITVGYGGTAKINANIISNSTGSLEVNWQKTHNNCSTNLMINSPKYYGSSCQMNKPQLVINDVDNEDAGIYQLEVISPTETRRSPGIVLELHEDHRKQQFYQGSELPVRMERKNLNAPVVVGIDFGTTYSGYWFSFRDEYMRDDSKIYCNTNWRSGYGLVTTKTPTVILFDKNGEFHSFGYEAEEAYTQLIQDGEADGYSYFSRFKMVLFQDEDSKEVVHSVLKGKNTISRNLILEDENGHTMNAMKVFSESIKYLKDHFMRKIESVTKLVETDIDWVLTVPAIWKDNAKQFMREAAQQAGIDPGSLTLAYEPEVAAFYCIEGAQGSNWKSFEPGQQFLVLDCGGGTMDVTSYQVQNNYEFKELYIPSGGPWGGTCVDTEYLAFLENLFGHDVWSEFIEENPEDLLEIKRKFEEKKRGITAQPNKVRIPFPFSLLTRYTEKRQVKSVKEGFEKSRYSQTIRVVIDKLVFDPDIMKEFFKKTIYSIITHVKGILDKNKRQGGVIGTILMVGGFSDSPLLYERVKSEFPKLNVICPSYAVAAVLKGAVMYGLIPNPLIQRVARRTYGIGVNEPFDDRKHSSRLKTFTYGRYVCTDVFKVMVRIGEPVIVGKSFEVSCAPSNIFDTEANIEVYETSNTNPIYTFDADVSLLGMLTVHIPNIDGGHSRRININMHVGSTELLVTAVEEGTRGGLTVGAHFSCL